MTTKLIPPGAGTGTLGGAAAADPARARRAGAWSLPEVRWAALATAFFAVGLIAHFSAAPAAVADGRPGKVHPGRIPPGPRGRRPPPG